MRTRARNFARHLIGATIDGCYPDDHRDMWWPGSDPTDGLADAMTVPLVLEWPLIGPISIILILLEE